MMSKFLVNVLLLFLGLSLLVLNGCSGLNQYVPAKAPDISRSEESRLGEIVSARLLQMLGGEFLDSALKADLNSLELEGDLYEFRVADSSRRAMYILPGKQVVLTHGLLADIKSSDELGSLLSYATRSSYDPLAGRTNREVAGAVDEFFAKRESIYNPEAASIRLARYFEGRGCQDDCLEISREFKSAGFDTKQPLPESFMRLKELKGGFELLALARDAEKKGKRAESIATYLQAATKAVDQPRILRALGMAYLRSGDAKSASLHLKKAAKLQPDYYRTQMGLGYLYLQQGEVDSAKDKLAASVKLLAVTENLFLLAEAMEKSDDLAGARSLYQLVAETDRFSKLGRTAASRLKETSGKYE